VLVLVLLLPELMRPGRAVFRLYAHTAGGITALGKAASTAGHAITAAAGYLTLHEHTPQQLYDVEGPPAGKPEAMLAGADGDGSLPTGAPSDVEAAAAAGPSCMAAVADEPASVAPGAGRRSPITRRHIVWALFAGERPLHRTGIALRGAFVSSDCPDAAAAALILCNAPSRRGVYVRGAPVQALCTSVRSSSWQSDRTMHFRQVLPATPW
jgi:hypothetical protein